jgi:hypothetical protein
MSKASEFYRKVVGTSKSYEETTHTYHAFLNAEVQQTRITRGDISYRGFAYTKIKPESFGIDPVQTFWELVPFSFVVDWFVDVGSKLQLASYLSTSIPGTLVSGCGVKVTATRDSVLTTTVGDRLLQGAHWYQVDNLTANASATAILVTRQALSPSLIPNVNVNLDFLKVVDMTALIKVLRR